MEEIEDELSWDDIQRLTCAFIICILGTAAHKGFYCTNHFPIFIVCSARFDILDDFVFLRHHFLRHLVDFGQNGRFLQIDDEKEDNEPKILVSR